MCLFSLSPSFSRSLSRRNNRSRLCHPTWSPSWTIWLSLFLFLLRRLTWPVLSYGEKFQLAKLTAWAIVQSSKDDIKFASWNFFWSLKFLPFPSASEALEIVSVYAVQKFSVIIGVLRSISFNLENVPCIGITVWSVVSRLDTISGEHKIWMSVSYFYSQF